MEAQRAMSLETVIETLWAIFGKEGVGPILANPHALLLLFIPPLLAIAVALARFQRLLAAACAFGLAALLGSGFALVQTGVVALPTNDRAPPVPTFELLPGQTLIGGGLKSHAYLLQQRLTLDDCQRTCVAESACLAFTYDTAERSCLLKGAVTSRHPHAASVSGIKRRAPGAASAK
jgi:hypothetical protein